METDARERIFPLLLLSFLTILDAGTAGLPSTNPLAVLPSQHGTLSEAGYISLTQASGNKENAGDRPGQATTTHSCGHIRAVPSELRSADIIKPNGLPTFYHKYTEAYGIPVLGSVNVTDTALQRACYVLRFLLADHSRVRQSVYARSGRVAVIGTEEQSTDIPEHRAMGREWNSRARGLGATEGIPVATCGEENVLCGRTDRWWDEDIALHEMLHGVHLLGAKLVLESWQQRLYHLYSHAKYGGLWAATYSLTSPAEYFAEGAQSYFNANPYYSPPNGVHGPISTQARLQTYDPGLFQLVREVFPCNNTYLKRCLHTRDEELEQPLRMNCDLTNLAVAQTALVTSSPTTTTNWNTTQQPPTSSTVTQTTPGISCRDANNSCGPWARTGQCSSNPGYMLAYCRKSCRQC